MVKCSSDITAFGFEPLVEPLALQDSGAASGTSTVQSTGPSSASIPPAVLRLCMPIAACHLVLLLCVVDELTVKPAAVTQLLGPVLWALTVVTVASAIFHVAATRAVDTFATRTTLITLLQVLWESNMLTRLWIALAVAAIQRALQLAWLILLLIQQPFSWVLPHTSMSIAAVAQIPVAILDAFTMNPMPAEPQRARKLQWQRRWAHALLLWAARCNVSFTLASVASTYQVSAWLFLLQAAALAVFTAAMLVVSAAQANGAAATLHTIAAYIIIKLPGAFAAGMGFWCLEPFDLPGAPAGTCDMRNWIHHGVAWACDVLLLLLVTAVALDLTPLTTPLHGAAGPPDSTETILASHSVFAKTPATAARRGGSGGSGSPGRVHSCTSGVVCCAGRAI
eukprot:jgi/Ulvmu1/6727/UM030_0062.1